MVTEITVTVLPEEENAVGTIEKRLRLALEKQNVRADGAFSYTVEKRSVDARHGKMKIHLRCKVFIGEEAEGAEDDVKIPEWKRAETEKRVIIVGAGPAGLFGALTLLEHGIKPVIVERGEETAERKKRIIQINRTGIVDGDSNYCFGEGGAGTFSDGKLFTRSKKRGDVGKILRIFAFFGADKRILSDAHPHIGTDKLPKVVNAIKNEIQRLGGEIHFNTRCEDFIMRGGRIWGVRTKNARTGEAAEWYGEAVILAAGHSAPEIYALIAKIAPSALEAKTFAAGVRVEHPRALIDAIQYKQNASKTAGAAEYRLTAQADGRGVYSFCMCPGGFIVPSSTANEGIAVNGMSASARNSNWSNAAIVVEIRPEDIPDDCTATAKDAGSPALAGLYFRDRIEREAKRQGSGQKAPAQLLNDFLQGRDSAALPRSSYAPGLTPSRLDKWLPEHITRRLKTGFAAFDKVMRGFICRDALLVAPETRTSTPVRIVRDAQTLECVGIRGLYPAGECSGYSGGIVSSAIDGERAARTAANCVC
ncbi:MAG: NAD(P)/FAD-dependent oxidoreductase [Treponema sp.]